MRRNHQTVTLSSSVHILHSLRFETNSLHSLHQFLAFFALILFTIAYLYSYSPHHDRDILQINGINIMTTDYLLKIFRVF